MRLQDYFDYSVRTRGDILFAAEKDRSINYRQAGIEVNKLANGLMALGLQKGDRFSYLSKNSIDMTIAYLASAITGIVIVPLNYRLAPVELAYIVKDSESKILFAQQDFIEGMNGVLSKI